MNLFTSLGSELAQGSFAQDASAADSGFERAVKKMKKDLKVKVLVIREDKNHMIMRVDNVDCSTLNSLRRVALADLPSIAISKVKRFQNVSAIYDEVLTARLGLMPMRVDPYAFDFPVVIEKDSKEKENELDPERSLFFKLQAENTVADSVLTVKTGDLVMKLLPGQLEKGFDKFGLVHDDIVINKLGFGHKMDLTCRALKGHGSQHVAFQPTSAVYVRNIPVYTLKQQITGALYNRLVQCFPEARNVFEMDEKRKKVVRVRPDIVFRDTSSRNFMSDSDLAEAIDYKVMEKSMIFSLESVGGREASQLTLEAIQCMRARIRNKIPQFKATKKSEKGAG